MDKKYRLLGFIVVAFVGALIQEIVKGYFGVIIDGPRTGRMILTIIQTLVGAAMYAMLFV